MEITNIIFYYKIIISYESNMCVYKNDIIFVKLK